MPGWKISAVPVPAASSIAAETPAKQTLSRKLTERLKEERLAHEEPKQGDWMNTLREKSTDEAAPKASETTEPASVFTSSSVDRTGSLLGWLDDETPFSEDLKAAEKADLPDWLKEETPEQESPPILPDLPMTENRLPRLLTCRTGCGIWRHPKQHRPPAHADRWSAQAMTTCPPGCKTKQKTPPQACWISRPAKAMICRTF